MKQFLCLGLLILVGCSAHPLQPSAQDIDISFDTKKTTQHCQYKGLLVGSQGDIISYWFTADRDLVTGALNDLKNQTAQYGANTVLLREQIELTTSATFIAEAYHCP
ncbi:MULTISPECIES: DUF4156 domain-containing protein [Pseudoalteromonas]|uniref:DUF4156 domain-containing protein n=1 Tax=Pseudoalteromonas TaxID=53246 RepID=UPI0002EECDC8|nr:MULTISPECIES: DUF4156 domain-containing protein [Pseudoalteromonas]MCF6144428.1 hypothetical protein [Pseudoalteromonas mariniglutinosa NCIMB 1770]